MHIVRDAICAAFAFAITVVWLLLLRRIIPTLSGIDEIFPLNIPGSSTAEQLNNWRLEQADNVLSTLPRNDTQADGVADVRINVIATKRKGNFLTQAIAGLLAAWMKAPEISAKMSICDVSKSENEEVERLSQYVSVFHSESAISSAPMDYQSSIAKEFTDYLFCLNHTEGERYLILVEDDAMPVPHFVPLIASIAQQMDMNKCIDYVKLYHSINLRRIPYYFQLLLASISLAVLFVYVFHIYHKYLFTILIASLLTYHIHIHYTFQLFADIRYRVSGSAYLTVPESCCTVAVLFRSSRIQDMLQYFGKLNYTGKPKDDLLDKSPFEARMSDTNIVQHIGYYSSLRGKSIALDVFQQRERQSKHIFPF